VIAVALALVSSLGWGTADFIGGLQARRRPLTTVLLLSQTVAVTIAIALVLGSGDGLPEPGPAALAFGAGAAGCAAIAAFYRGLAIGTMSIVAPVSAAGAIVPVLAGIADGERPNGLQVVGIVVALVGIILAARESAEYGGRGNLRAAVGLSLLAALGFGSFFVLLDHATADSGVPWALLLTRLGTVALLLIAFAVTRPALPARLRECGPLALVGTLDVFANATFALATTRGLLSIIAVVGSLYPAVTVVLARFVLSERVSRLQQAGVVATLAGVAAISAG
jgi:drug/metabolite transporter (DMT)-like permease